MRKIAVIVSVALCYLCSCSTKVDLYVGFTDTTVVYGVLDVAKDTNMIKITRAFAGSNDDSFDVYQVVQLADSLNYPGKLDARLIEYRGTQGNAYAHTGREIVLDTITIHNKEEGMFYAPDQKMYFTTDHFNVNDGNEKYKYKLAVCKSNDTITSEIGLLGSKSFQIHSSMVYFRSKNAKTQKLFFTPDDNDAIYQIKMQFNYKELHPKQDTVNKNIVMDLGSFDMMDLSYENNSYFVTYHESTLFRALATAIGHDTIHAERFFNGFVVSISAYGKELHNYTLTNQPSGIADYSYTNINGGCGVLSSRFKLEKNLRLSSLTQTDLLSMPWGFKNLGY